MNLTDASNVTGLALGIIALLGAVLGWLRWVRPRWLKATGRVGAALDTIAGRPEITDNITGAVLAPALPSVGMRLGTLEESVSRLVEAEIERQQLDRRVTEAHERIDTLDKRVRGLEEATIERVANKAESVAAFRAIEAVAKNGDPITPQIEETP